MFVGDASLAELKKVLIGAGYKVCAVVVTKRVRSFTTPQTELRGGLLLCNEQVLVRKVLDNDSGEPTLRIDGVLGRDYYDIRALLYGQFHVL